MNYKDQKAVVLKTRRIHYIDVAKGILILLLLVSHFGTIVNRIDIDGASFACVYYLYSFFWPFFMEGFFFVSGYCSHFDVDPLTFLKKQVKELVVPWAFFVVLNKGIYSIPVMISVGGAHSDVLWFLIALFFSKWIVYLIRKVIKSERLILAICLFLFVLSTVMSQYNILVNVFYVWQALGATLFVDLGIYMKHQPKLYNKLSGSFWAVAVYVVLCLMMIFFNFRVPPLDAGYHPSILQASGIIVWSIFGIFALLSICRKIDANRLLEFWGRNTLVIYCFHAIPYMFVVYLLSIVSPPPFCKSFSRHFVLCRSFRFRTADNVSCSEAF